MGLKIGVSIFVLLCTAASQADLSDVCKAHPENPNCKYFNERKAFCKKNPSTFGCNSPIYQDLPAAPTGDKDLQVICAQNPGLAICQAQHGGTTTETTSAPRHNEIAQPNYEQLVDSWGQVEAAAMNQAGTCSPAEVLKSGPNGLYCDGNMPKSLEHCRQLRKKFDEEFLPTVMSPWPPFQIVQGRYNVMNRCINKFATDMSGSEQQEFYVDRGSQIAGMYRRMGAFLAMFPGFASEFLQQDGNPFDSKTRKFCGGEVGTPCKTPVGPDGTPTLEFCRSSYQAWKNEAGQKMQYVEADFRGRAMNACALRHVAYEPVGAPPHQNTPEEDSWSRAQDDYWLECIARFTAWLNKNPNVRNQFNDAQARKFASVQDGRSYFGASIK